MQGAEFDYVVVGAGSAGAALAARLSENDNFRVALIEAGGQDRSIWIHVPLGVGKLLHDKRFIWPFSTEPEPELHGRRIYTPRGKVIGGSSSVNGLAWVRGEPKEFDHWRALGNEGWGFDDILPYYKCLEDYPDGDPAVRGHGGPMKIINRGIWDPDPLSAAYLEACVQAGIPRNDDYNGRQFEGVGYLQQNEKNGRRCSTATAYLKPARKRVNLKVITGAIATRVLLDGKRATGIEYLHDNDKRVIRARGEVILAAGTIKSPQLLELSGIGDADLLRKFAIPVVVDLPGVGENLSDHAQVRFTYECTRPITINDIMTNAIKRYLEGLKYILTRRGLLSGSSSTVHALARSAPDMPGADLKIQINLISGKDRYSRTAELGIDPYSGFSIGVLKIRPVSRGSIHIRDVDPLSDPVIKVNYLTHPSDIETYRRSFGIMRKIASQPALQPFIRRETRPGPEVTNDEDLLDYARRTAQTAWHAIGTCRMGSDGMAVVDSRLRVRGVEGLRIVDISIMPTMVSPNTNAPAVLIGEKAADMIAQDDRRNQ